MRSVAIVILIVGVLLLAKGFWIPLKASISQVLLSRAWEHARMEQDYRKPWPWADVTAVGKLSVPTLGIEQVILSGMSGQSLAFGPGHNSQTALPGETGLVMLGGHRDTHFSYLQDLSGGDALHLEGRSGSQHYKVRETFVLDTRVATLHNDVQDQLLLVTCYPFDGSIPTTPYRYVIVADKI